MATQAVVSTTQAVTPTQAPTRIGVPGGTKPVLPPAGSGAGPGPTSGQLFPVGNR
jgi:hypothetical protein